MPEIQRPVQRRPIEVDDAINKEMKVPVKKVVIKKEMKIAVKKVLPKKTRETTEKVKLTSQQVLDLKKLFANYSCEGIARDIGCQHYQIYRVIYGTSTVFPKPHYKALMDKIKQLYKLTKRLIKNV